jgi:hypothetical protein
MPTLAKDNEMAIIPTSLLEGQKRPHELDKLDSNNEATPAIDPQYSELLSRPLSFASLSHAKVILIG